MNKDNSPLEKKQLSKFEYTLLTLSLNVNDLPLTSEQLEHLQPMFKAVKEAHEEVVAKAKKMTIGDIIKAELLPGRQYVIAVNNRMMSVKDIDEFNDVLNAQGYPSIAVAVHGSPHEAMGIVEAPGGGHGKEE